MAVGLGKLLFLTETTKGYVVGGLVIAVGIFLVIRDYVTGRRTPADAQPSPEAPQSP